MIGVYLIDSNSFILITKGDSSIPSWLPDSRRIVYSIDNKIFLANIENKQVKELLSLQSESPRSPFVSRDGKFLYFVAHLSKSDIWLLDTSGN